MIRRLAILALLACAGCPSTEEPTQPDPTTGTVQGTLTPFRSGAASAAVVSPRLPASELRDLTGAVHRAVAAREVTHASPPPQDSLIPGEVIVRFDEANLSKDAALERARMPGYRATHLGFISEYLHVLRYSPDVVQAQSGAAPVRALARDEHEGIVKQLSVTPGVRYAESNLKVTSFAVPDDPYYARQWHYANMNLPAAWDITTGSDSMVVAVVDTGITKHPDLDARILPGIDLISSASAAGDGDGPDNDPTDMGNDGPSGSSSFHGTHVAGTIGAVSNNKLGVAGVTWKGKVLPVRVLGTNGGTLADIAAGMNWATGGTVPGVRANTTPARVVNLSLGGTGSAPQSVQDIVNTAVNTRNAIFVIAAGNENVNASGTFPCNMQNVICVGAVRFDGRRASYSNFGSVVDVMATGGQTSEDRNGDGFPDGVLSTLPDSNRQPSYGFYNGTSMAAPHVAGVVALMLAVNPALTATEVENILKDTADTTSQCAEGCGAGLVNAQAAVLRAKGGGDPNAPPKLAISTTQLSFTGGGTQQLAVRNTGGGKLQVGITVAGTQSSAVSVSSNSVSVDAYKSTLVSVTVKQGSLPVGDYVAQLTLTASPGGTANVLVKFKVGSLQDKDALIAFAYQDKTGAWQVDKDAVLLVPATGGYHYSAKLTPHTYYALATIDEDGDGELFEDGERVGYWRDATEFESFDVKTGITVQDISFSLAPGESSDPEPTSLVGQPCTKDSQCGTGGICATNYPSGYCTLSCVSSSCPSGSKCYATSDVANAYCFATCSGIGTQGSCRTGYICAPDNAGNGACVPQ
ncbi:peptidase S8 [Corallococcus sp. H22C18031201]|nr:peptidase S8 [Corallococcus sp. H22C18031201]